MASQHSPGHEFPPREQFLTVAEVSRMLRVSKMTIYRLLHAGEIQYVQVGRSFRIPAEAVSVILENRTMLVTPKVREPGPSG
ncbi:MAG TPA: helix-turn-helix domain-containing protein [Pseudonocardia sp.]|uniref:helix-turn-helix domain-containing protein n=1 Tax=Pseudonocardia sp. TaxID=60912 RepID=UPI002C095446|nr:helix-turn-helix domain-containing protein [Pseudonocardia sp.]HTF49779.1 helix-turn-helix domain-containing protein [Pseudonocardia sp.]